MSRGCQKLHFRHQVFLNMVYRLFNLSALPHRYCRGRPQLHKLSNILILIPLLLLLLPLPRCSGQPQQRTRPDSMCLRSILQGVTPAKCQCSILQRATAATCLRSILQGATPAKCPRRLLLPQGFRYPNILPCRPTL